MFIHFFETRPRHAQFAKAFDKVPHLRLLSKLTSYGITGNTQNWIKSFLSNRKQRVSVNGALSDITDVTSGVPQGSVLGPVLFLLYINDINGNIKSSIRLFADDSIIYRKISSKTDHEILQTDLSQLQTWSDKWQMEFNVSKCVHLPITNKTKPSTHKYSLSGQPLSTVSSHSYLGVKLDSKLTWTNHVTDISHIYTNIIIIRTFADFAISFDVIVTNASGCHAHSRSCQFRQIFNITFQVGLPFVKCIIV